jgi:hypothetical protein
MPLLPHRLVIPQNTIFDALRHEWLLPARTNHQSHLTSSLLSASGALHATTHLSRSLKGVAASLYVNTSGTSCNIQPLRHTTFLPPLRSCSAYLHDLDCGHCVTVHYGARCRNGACACSCTIPVPHLVSRNVRMRRAEPLLRCLVPLRRKIREARGGNCQSTLRVC